MAEVTAPAEAIWVDYQCDDCKGKVVATGIMDRQAVVMNRDEVWPHFCDGCNREYRFTVKYPVIRHIKK